MPGRDAMRGLAVLTFLFVLVAVILLAGCSVSVEEPRLATEKEQRTALSTSAAPLPQYDVAISAVDFDPPLRGEALLTVQQPVKLVAAIENKGAMQLSKLTVEARVTDRRGDVSLQDRVSLDKLSPGETRVVEFGRSSPLVSLPHSSSFRVTVSVDSPQLNPVLPRPSKELIVRVSEQ